MNGKGSTASCSSGNNKAENTGEFCDDSPPKKMKASGAISAPEDGAGGFKAAWSDAVRDINLLFTKYSEVLRERAALDASQIQELTNILNEAMSLESELREKKEQLRQALAMISDKLQG